MAITTAVNAQSDVSYKISFSEPQAHYIDVEMIYKSNRAILDYTPSIIKMPVWAPGSYLIREFAKNVEGLQATGEKGNPLKVEKTAKNTWAIFDQMGEKVTVKYRIYAFEASVRTSFVDASHAFLSPTGIFMYVDNDLKKSASVSIKPYQGWNKVSTGLEAVKGKEFTYFAPDFDILYDSPIEVGNQDIFEFNASGVKHEVAMYGGGNYDKERLKIDMAKLVVEETAVFGVNPNKRYVFIVHNYSTGGGGIEHLNSTVLGATRLAYDKEAGYDGFLGLVAHEYFHLWNVKRLRPIALGPFDYEKENYTTNLWIAEGFTAYYDNLMMRRAGFHTPEKYLDVLSASINTLTNTPGNYIQSASEASFDAWIKYYRPNENSKNSTISYYDKGAMIALVFDLEILNATKGKKGLDDVMKAMYDEYYTRLGRGYTDAEFKAMAEKTVGKSFDRIYTDYIYGIKPID
ncbi:MAG: peptidase M61, partial [Daejeonella sp.]